MYCECNLMTECNLTLPGLYFVCIIKKILRGRCDALLDLVPFVQFKKREKHPLRSVNFSKVVNA